MHKEFIYTLHLHITYKLIKVHSIRDVTFLKLMQTSAISVQTIK